MTVNLSSTLCCMEPHYKTAAKKQKMTNLKFCMHLLCIFQLWFHCELILLSLILHNCKDLLKVEPDLCSETCVTSHDGNEVITVQAEATDEQHEEDPLLISFPVIKPEHEVSCIYVISPVLGGRLLICNKIHPAISLKNPCNKDVPWPCYGAVQC